MIAETLAGKRLFVTGATGFLGTALVERLLREVPDCQIVLLVRAGKRSTVQQRVAREILKNDAFDRLRAEHSGPGQAGGRSTAFDDFIAARLSSVPGDVSRDGLGLDQAGRAVLASCDIVIHSAATVSFDSPLDGAVEVNLLGPMRIAATLNDLGVTPHMVSVSTCYVAGNRRGAALEQMVDESPFFVDVSWRAEVEGARRARSDAEAQSRTPEELARYRKAARAELGAAGTPALAAKTEQLRAALGERSAGRGRAGPSGFAGLARRLRLHQGARRTGAGGDPWRRAHQHRPPLHHRVRPGRTSPGLDPGLPHGRAGDHLLRPGVAQGVPGRARGHRRRHPR